MIPDETVERVRETADIVGIVGEYVKLKRTGNSYRGPCPFHQGKNDNFSVSPKGGYTCFVCGEKGDVFTFIQKHLGLDFVGAVKLVGEKSGVEVQETVGNRPQKDPREPFWEINNAAAAFFQSQLRDAPLGSQARDYLASRKIAPDHAARFGLGYAPRGDALSKHLAGLGFSEKRQLDAGLLVLPEGRVEALVRFRNRLMFPISDPRGNTVGFGGRILGEGEPKYLNSPESEFFAKRRLLYGIHTAKNAIRKADRVFIVEGYFDAIRLILAGFDEVVAPMGTALTAEQVELLKKYSTNIFLLYDGDKAGLRATFRSGDVLLKAGMSVRVVSFPDGEDPDSFTNKHGATGVNRELSRSIDVFDRKVQLLERGGFFSDVRRTREAVDKLLATVRLTADPISRALYLARTAEISGIRVETLEAQLKEVSKPESEPAPHQDKQQKLRAHGRKKATIPPRGFKVETALIYTLLHRRDLIDLVADTLDPQIHFRNPDCRSIFFALLETPEATIEELAARVPDPAVEALQDLLVPGEGLHHEAVVRGALKSLIGRELIEVAQQGQQGLAEASASLQLAERERLKAKMKSTWESLPRPVAAEHDLKIDRLLVAQHDAFVARIRAVNELRALGIPFYKAVHTPASSHLDVDQTPPAENSDTAYRRAVGDFE